MTMDKKKLNGITITTCLPELSQALHSGWVQLRNSPSHKIYTEAFDFFKKAGLYEGLFRPQIPNPVYDNAAKELGKPFLNCALHKGLYFKELFPGDFDCSTEQEMNGLEYRVFYLTVFHNKNKLGMYQLMFAHNHERFDFPVPPTIEVFSSEDDVNE